MANMEQIKIQISGDTSSFQKELNKAFKWAQQKGKTIFGKSQSSNQQNSQSAAERKAQKDLGDKITRSYKKQQSMTSYFNAGSSRAKQTIDASGDMASLQRGGFYSAIASKGSFAKGAKDWVKGRYKDYKGITDKELGGGKMPGMPGSGGLPGMGGKGQNMTVNASTVIVKGGNGGQGTFGQSAGGRGGGMGRDAHGLLNAPGRPGFNSSPESGIKGAVGRISNFAKTLPYAGVVVQAVSGLMQLASSAGEQYAAGQERQAGTLGALGRHIGSTDFSKLGGDTWEQRKEAGQGFLSNADVAQGMVSYGRESGMDVYDKGGGKALAFKEFTASQGESSSAVMAVVGKFEQVMNDFSEDQQNFDEEMLAQMRAESHKAGFENLKEMEFMKGIADQAGSMRSQGFGSNPMEFAKFVSSLGGLTNERKMSIGKQLDTSGAKGIFGGGLTGQLAMAAALQNGGDIFEVTKRMETDPEFRAEMMRKGLGMIGAEGSQSDRDTFGMIMKQQGTMSMTEGSNLYTDTSKAQTTHGIRAKENEALRSQNIIEDVYQKIGQKPFEASQNFAVDMANLTQKLGGVIESTTKFVETLEKVAYMGLDPATGALEKVGNVIKEWLD